MPSRTKVNQNQFYYLYVLVSKKDGQHYIGMTRDLRKRFLEHNKGINVSTRSRRPLELIYYEACLSYEDTRAREVYFKGTGGRRFLAKRLRAHYKQRNSLLS